MNARAALWLPVVLGGATGALLAVTGAPPRVEPEAAPSVQPSSRPPALEFSSNEPLAAVPSVRAPAAIPDSEAPSPRAVADVGAPTTPSASAPKLAFDLTPPSTREGLLEAEIRCNRKSPEDCERAARAIDAGQAVAKDVERARMVRRIALTLYVRQCESGRAVACARLAEMYGAGETVQKNLRNAAALRDRVRALCRQKPAELGCGS